jgi:lipoteichoic acid synthase
MSTANHEARAPAPSLWTVWSRASLAWVAGLCLPLFALSLHFKLLRIARRHLDLGPRELAELLLSDLTTVAAWAAVSMGLVAWGERRAVRTLVRAGLQVGAVLYASLLLGAHGYFMSTGSSLDYPMLAFSLANLRETAEVIGSAGSPGRMAAYAATVVAVAVLPWAFALAVKRPPDFTRASDRWLTLLHGWSLAGMCLAVAIGVQSEWGRDLARDPFLNIALTFGQQQSFDEDDRDLVARARARPTGARDIKSGAHTQKKNVVIIMLESTGAAATSLYGPHATTPFLAELARESLLVERMYAVEPHTSKALATTLCGIEPRPGIGTAEAVPGGILGTCLPQLLGTQGYRTTFMQAATRNFESRPQLVRNMGFDAFESGDQMSHQGLARANYFGWEDRILLGPLSAFLERSRRDGRPFLLAVLTNQPHHEYRPVRSYGSAKFSHDETIDNYLNAVRYDDFLLRDVFARFEAAGLLESTIFLILGDHGEGFGEHDRYAHDDTIYEEGLRIPMLVHAPGDARARGRLPGIHNELDVVPTVLDLLGFEIGEGGYVGRSLFADGPPRVLYAACYNDDKCVARFEGDLKFIHHFGRQKDELFDVVKDPRELRNLARVTLTDVEPLRADVLDWYRQTRVMYRDVTRRLARLHVSRVRPAVQHARTYRFGSAVEYLGYSIDLPSARPGSIITVTYHFKVLERLPAGFHLFVRGRDGAIEHVWDHVPVYRMFPEEEWRPGQYVSDPHRIVVPDDWASGRFVLTGGFSGPRARRLRVTPEAPGDEAILADVPVAE